MTARFALLVATLTAAGCQTLAGAGEQPARLVAPDAAVRTALHEAVAAELGVEVLLAEDALTDASALVIERVVRRGPDGTPLQGRVMEAPIRFRLVTDGADCILVDERDDSRQVLEEAECRAE